MFEAGSFMETYGVGVALLGGTVGVLSSRSSSGSGRDGRVNQWPPC